MKYLLGSLLYVGIASASGSYWNEVEIKYDSAALDQAA